MRRHTTTSQRRLQFRPRRGCHAIGFAMALITLFAPIAANTAQASEDWNVLLLTFDTTRADYIGCYGRENATTPNLDRLAAEGALFEHNFASHPVTQAAHSTIMTGVYPMVHGVRDNTFFKLADESETLAEMLRDAGWATGAAIGGFPLVKEFGIGQGFDFYDDDITGNREDFRGRPAARHGGSWYDERPAAHVNDAILPWLRDHIDERFFVWLHYWDPHLPHTAPPPYSELYAHDPYQGEIAYADKSLGTILDELKRTGVYDRTIVIVTSDHGESRMEHREATHAFLAYGSSLHVPLIINAPSFKGGRRVKQRVGTVDIVPTVLDLVGVDAPDQLQGRSLVPLIEDPALDEESPPLYYSESMSPRLSHGFGELRALYDGPLKYIFGPRPELFDLEADPDELHDLVATREVDATRMKQKLAQFIEDHASASAASAAHEVDDETRARLEALGYMDSGADAPEVVKEILRADGIAPQDRVKDINLNQRMRQQLDAGQFSLAKETAESLVEAAPQNVFYRASLVRALIGLGEIDEAATTVEATENLGGSVQGGFLAVAQALFEAGEHDRARKLATKIAEHEDSATVRIALARMAKEDGDLKAFDAEIARTLELDNEHPEALLEKGKALLEAGDLDAAEVHLRALLKAAPLASSGQLAWATLLQKRGDDNAALARVERVLRLGQASCESILMKYELLVALDRAEEGRRLRRQLERECRDDDATSTRLEELEAPTK
jgi:arylsulfatase A-like enzyme